jgi:hypothetical protein
MDLDFEIPPPPISPPILKRTMNTEDIKVIKDTLLGHIPPLSHWKWTVNEDLSRALEISFDTSIDYFQFDYTLNQIHHTGKNKKKNQILYASFL